MKQDVSENAVRVHRLENVETAKIFKEKRRGKKGTRYALKTRV